MPIQNDLQSTRRFIEWIIYPSMTWRWAKTPSGEKMTNRTSGSKRGLPRTPTRPVQAVGAAYGTLTEDRTTMNHELSDDLGDLDLGMARRTMRYVADSRPTGRDGHVPWIEDDLSTTT